MELADEVEIALDEVVAAMPGGGEARSGQRVMARAVAETIAQGGHLVVQAGTGTGKTLAYLLPAAMSGRNRFFCSSLPRTLIARDGPFR